ncbi:uncharacterized protein LOC132747003 isoform X2 [Ruditapes philippinarum]|nr:uncharacterized protein LOC132747003 isoform X2 [Ruditapes philippinarum]XP_060592290.1 uncharacterized protein LOC132747003 isoform X2 [Ruditapes philippinarum]
MELQEEVNQMLRHGQRECLHLKGLIRKVKSAQALLKMRKDEAKKDLEGYVNKLSESLIDFRAEMHVSIRAEVELKNSKLMKLCEKYEANIKSYTELCDAGEKLMYFGKSLNSPEERSKAKQLLQEFNQLLELTSGKDEICALVKLEFYPALHTDSIVPNMFGDLIIGSNTKPAETSMSVLAARKSNFSNDQSSETKIGEKPTKRAVVVEKRDQYTQTDKVVEKANITDKTEKQVSNQDSAGYHNMQCDQQYVSYPQNSPPGFGHVAMPYCSHESYPNLNPPPGFSVYQRPHAPQPYQVAGIQQPSVNPYILTNTPIYQGSGCNEWYAAMTTSANSYQGQNTYPCPYSKSVPQDPPCFYTSEQHYTGIPLVSKSNKYGKSSSCPDTNVRKVSNNSNKTVENSEVSNIPLPMGPMPRQNLIHCNKKMDIDFEQTSEAVEKTCGDKSLYLVSSDKENSGKNRNDNCAVEMETDELVNEGKNGLSEMNKPQSDIHRFEKLLERTNELLESSHINDVDKTKRTDEAEEVFIKKLDAEKTTNIQKIQDENKQKDITPNKNSNINKGTLGTVDSLLSSIGKDLKVKIERGEENVTTMKPLRRPLRLPKKCLSQSKTRPESNNDSLSSVDSGVIATENTNDNTTKTTFATQLDKKLSVPDQTTENMSPLSLDQVIKQENTDSVKVENVEEPTVTNGTDISNIKVEEVPDTEDSELLDLSVSSGTNLRDVVKSKGPSKSEVKELNKITLQSQTQWLKGYLQQMLPENKEKDTKPKITDENNNSSESNLTDRSKSESVNMDDETSTVVKEENVQTVDSGSDVIEAELKKKSELEVNTSKTKQTNKEYFEPNKDSVTERKTDMRNLKSAVKGFLGGQREANQRCTSTYSRLGALQAHWLKNSPGTAIKAKFLFSCSEDMHFPIGVTTNSLQQIIVADTGNHCIKMFDQNGKLIRACKGHNMRRPSAVVVNEFDHIFVKDDLSIKVFDNLGDYMMNIDTEFTRPFGLVLTPAKCLLVLETDRRHPALVHVSQDGGHIWRFPYLPLINAPPGSKCRFMAVSENHVLVSDLGLSQIYITDLEGLSFKVIGMPGHEPQQFYEPSGISVDNYGNIVIGDSRNNRVQVFRHDGSFTGLIDFDEKIVRPSDIHLTSDNKLIVVNFIHHIIKVYQLLG